MLNIKDESEINPTNTKSNRVNKMKKDNNKQVKSKKFLYKWKKTFYQTFLKAWVKCQCGENCCLGNPSIPNLPRET